MVLADLSKRLTHSLRKFGSRQSAQAVEEVDLLLKEIGDALIAADVSVPYVNELKEQIRTTVLDENFLEAEHRVKGGWKSLGSQQKQRTLQKAIVRHLADLLAGESEGFAPCRGGGNAGAQVVLFVGLQGSGKTTTITKYAHYYKMKNFRVALVCADTFRAGAFDQLKQNATKIHCPFYGSYTETDPVLIAEEGVDRFKEGLNGEKYDLILVDSSGRHKQEQALFEEMEQLHTAISPTAVVLVMDSHIGQAGFRQAESFANSVDIGSVILTKMDDSSGTKNKGGGALSAVAATGAPVIFLGTGEHFDDFERFDAEGFVSKLLGLGDMKGLFNEISSNLIDLDSLKNISTDGNSPPSAKNIADCLKGTHKNLFGNLMAGKFTLRNLYEMFSSMGPMGNLMNMLPGGMSGLLPPGVDKKQANERMRKLIVIMDSMTDAELDGAVDVRANPSRRKRIVRGAGLWNNGDTQLQQLFNEHARISEMVEKMGLGNMDFNNPMAMMANMKKAMTPDMKKQMKNMLGGMGGMGGMVESMMESMGMGKMPPGMVDSMMGAFLDDDGPGMTQIPGMPPGAFPPGAALGTGGSASSSTLRALASTGRRVLQNDVPVVIQGLQSRPGENGKTGKILAYDEAKGRYMVGGIEGVAQPLALKPANVVRKGVKVLLSEGGPGSEQGTGSPGEGAQTVLGWDVEKMESLDQVKFKVDSSSAEVALSDTCTLAPKEVVRVQGLQSDKGKVWNDHYGVVLGYDAASGRYAVDMEDGELGKTQLKIKPTNMTL